MRLVSAPQSYSCFTRTSFVILSIEEIRSMQNYRATVVTPLSIAVKKNTESQTRPNLHMPS